MALVTFSRTVRKVKRERRGSILISSASRVPPRKNRRNSIAINLASLQESNWTHPRELRFEPDLIYYSNSASCRFYVDMKVDNQDE